MNTETKTESAAPERTARVPRVDVWRSETGFRVLAELPGAQAESVKLTTERGVLTLFAESPRHTWKRSFELPEDIDAEAIAARLEKGLLDITLPRVPTARSRQIRVLSA
jgi:HSP20 family protein